MNTVGADDILARLRSLLPPWFPSATPVLDAVLSGAATAFAWIYGRIAYVAAQARLGTATGPFLDMLSVDWFGFGTFPRLSGESDDFYRARIELELFRERSTRKGIERGLTNLTGFEPKIFEPWNAQDTGGFGVTWALNEASSKIGSDALPYNVFIDAVEPPGAGIPNLAGLNDAQGGLGAGEFAMADLGKITGAVTNADIYRTVNSCRAAGVTAWVSIGPPPVISGRIGIDFAIGLTPLG